MQRAMGKQNPNRENGLKAQRAVSKQNPDRENGLKAQRAMGKQNLNKGRRSDALAVGKNGMEFCHFQ